MKRIEVINASAGSGKTHRLAECLEHAVLHDGVRPEAILATTFTRRAAAELAERVRTRLLAAGQEEKARRLSGARIGTVHSVCGQLVEEHSFELGLSPSPRVLDESSASELLGTCLASSLGEGEATELAVIATRFENANWRELATQVIRLARVNGMNQAALSRCAQASREAYGQLLGEPGDAGQIEGDLIKALCPLVLYLESGDDPTKTATTMLARLSGNIAALESGRSLCWRQWASLETFKDTKRTRDLADEVRVAAALHHHHPLLRQDGDRLIELVFQAAVRTMDGYQKEKRERGRLDFEDQEVLALQLLNQEIPRAVLGESLDLVLVDEFQDTSPLQLAIFLKLAELSPRNVWVGDPKQSIYGFRGADAHLMQAVVQGIAQEGGGEILNTSWRSRPELVRVTNDLFGEAFELHGIARDHVELSPALVEEPEDLGPILERWDLDGRSNEARIASLATGIQHVLADPKECIRDRISGESRRLLPGDVAVLCETNQQASCLATALTDRGVLVSIARAGLLSGLLGRVLRAGLRLWVDGRDRLARAELARVLAFPDRPEEWFERVMARLECKDSGPLFEDLRSISRLQASQRRHSCAGPVAALDLVTEALELRERCLSWGNAPEHLGQLESLRAHAVTYAECAQEEGVPATPAGLIAHFDVLSRAGRDTQAGLPEGAVQVVTWHGSKGMEWPMVYLLALRKPPLATPLGVSVVASKGPLNLKDPLSERMVRLLPDPYHRSQKKTRFHMILSQDPATEAVSLAAEAERLRLIYVGWTRARDRLILAAAPGKLRSTTMKSLPSLVEPVQGQVSWGGAGGSFCHRKVVEEVPEERVREGGSAVLPLGPQDYPPAYQAASRVPGNGEAGDAQRIGVGMGLKKSPDMERVGRAVHAYLARPAGIRCAEEVLDRWDLGESVDPEELAMAGRNLLSWLDARYPDCRREVEWPLQVRVAGGTVIEGVADLVLETEEGLVVIDHKSFPGTQDQARARAREHAGQLGAYAEALTLATGMPIRECWIHLPLRGWMIPVECARPEPEIDLEGASESPPSSTGGSVIF
jgi:ATP-dependent exoDNAse (exonuclease V) beta subunit